MIFKDYYKILSLETNRVSSEQIKNAYRTAAKKYHPDINAEDRLSEEKIKDVNEAYRVLSNPSTKRKYDRMWVNNVGKKKYQEASRSSGSVFSDFFNMFFGANIEEKENINKTKVIPIKGENIFMAALFSDRSELRPDFGSDSACRFPSHDSPSRIFEG